MVEKASRQEGLEHPDQLDELTALLLVEGSDDHALVRDDPDEPLRLQLPERFPQRRPADARQLAELALDQAVSRSETGVEDGLPERLDDLMPERCGNARHPERVIDHGSAVLRAVADRRRRIEDRKSTRLNSSH